MSLQKIRNQWWIIVNGQPRRQATEKEIKRFMVTQLIKNFQTA